jgi:hypothetical protein
MLVRGHQGSVAYVCMRGNGRGPAVHQEAACLPVHKAVPGTAASGLQDTNLDSGTADRHPRTHQDDAPEDPVPQEVAFDAGQSVLGARRGSPDAEVDYIEVGQQLDDVLGETQHRAARLGCGQSIPRTVSAYQSEVV